MAEQLILLGDSAAVRCLGMQTQYASFHAAGLANKVPLANDLDYIQHNDNYHEDLISYSDGCVLAARIALTRNRPDLIPCNTCENESKIDTDPIVAILRGRKGTNA